MTAPTQPLLVRNTQPGPTVFALDASNTSVVEWKGSGDRMGEDLQPVPPEFQNNINFQRAVARGILEIVDSAEELARVEALHRQEWTDRSTAAAQASQDVLDQAPKNDITMVGCIAPNGNGTPCGVQIPVRVQQINDAPPLCGQHSSLKARYVAETTEQLVQGKPQVKWTMVQLDPRIRQQQ